MEKEGLSVKDLREMLAAFPEDIPVTFQLDPNGTNYRIAMLPAYTTTDSLGNPTKATSVTFYERPPEEEEVWDFPDQVRLGLPDEFLDLCARDKVEPREVLHGFIADLCEIHNWAKDPRADGLSSNGSDERRLAEEYYERAGYRYRHGDEA